ncbi:hypothetical protein GF360_02420 [candidate division WWE3 bacterium]|nr:hypothetical protein [candidate division WWE3 bacterium]
MRAILKKHPFLTIVISATLVYFFSWFFAWKIGVNDLPIQSEDTLPAIFMPVTILKEGTIYLDSYYDMLLSRYPHPDDKSYEKGLVPFYLREVISDSRNDTHYVSAFTIITPLLALPVYFLPVLLGVSINWTNLIVLSHLAASFIVALSGGFLYLLLRKHFFSQDSGKTFFKQKSLLLTAIYLFATINFAHISQALWQHGTVQLFTILALWAIYEKRYPLTGLFFGLMILSRPTSAIPVTLLGLAALTNLFNTSPSSQVEASERKTENTSFKRTFADRYCGRNVSLKDGVLSLIALSLGFLPTLIFFLWYNKTYYGNISNQGYSNQIFTEWKGRFPEGFLGLWISPSKGILIYSPIFIFSLAGLYLAVKNRKQNLNCIILGLIVLIHTLVLGKWKHWYGGWSFGYRMASDVIPFLILLMVPFIKSSHFQKAKNLFFILFGLSIFVQFFGIVFYDGTWHSAYDLGYENTSWLWSLKNSELIFNIRRVLVKTGLRATPF